jgi:hypothetical protein
MAANVNALPKSRNRIPSARPRRNFLSYAALIKLNRITKAEMIFCRRHFGNAMLLAVFLIELGPISLK